MNPIFKIIPAILVIFSFSNSWAVGKTVDPLSRDELMKELLGAPKSEDGKDDLAIYSEIVSSYQSNDLKKLRMKLKSLISKYPRSAYVDNALYLAGRQAMENKNYPDAIRYFQKVIASYPQSNRVVSSQFAKAMTYKKMNLSVQARGVLKELKQKFPGSPESFRAENEIKLIR